MTIHDSVVRVLGSVEPFGDSFYEVLFRRHPEVREYFTGVDMKRQAIILTMGLSVIEQHYSTAYPATEQYIKHLGTRHHTRGIPRELYPKWRDAMLETLQGFHGPDWTAELADDWTQAIDLCSELMLEGHERRFTT